MRDKVISVLKLAILVFLNLLMIGIVAQVRAVNTGEPTMGGELAAISRNGSRGDEVRQIQQKLIEWDYLDGSADGIYGAATEKAVRAFQKRNGLTADGVAGPATLRAMGISSSTGSSSGGSANSGGSGGFSDSDYRLLARIISAEARGEAYEGQVAVGAVIMNRVEHPSFPNSISGVVYQPGAFTAITDGQINEPVTDSAYRAARDAMNGWDPSGGAIYYFNPDKTDNAWMRTRPVIKRIGDHLFCS